MSSTTDEYPKCPACNEMVMGEEMIAGDHKYHKECFKCGLCQKPVDNTEVTDYNVGLFCKQCDSRKFGPKGYGFGGGAGALSMDFGEQFDNKDSSMTDKPGEVI